MFRETIKQHVPRSVIGGMRAATRILTWLRQSALLWRTPAHWRNYMLATQFHNAHRGERCFIIGNGPSLSEMDLSPLRNEATFGLNRIYLLFDQLGFGTTYYVAVNRLVLKQFASDIEQLSMPKFIRWKYRHLLNPSPSLMYVRWRPGPSFSHDIRSGAWGGATVTYTALQLAYFMGFEQVILIGVDHSFQIKGEPHKEMVSVGADPNHFDPGYFGKGTRWQLPDLETSEVAYRLAKENFEADGRSILDATISGKLDIFQKVPYNHVITTAPREPIPISKVPR